MKGYQVYLLYFIKNGRAHLVDVFEHYNDAVMKAVHEHVLPANYKILGKIVQ